MVAVAEYSRDDKGAGSRARGLSNDGLIIQLIQTLNHLSRWLTPIHNQTVLDVSLRRAEPSVKELVIGLRDTEARAYAMMNAIAAETNPDLDRVPRVQRTAAQIESDRQSNTLVMMSEFRRLRESTTSLLRALPDNAWERGGYSRTERDWTIRELAEFLAANDWNQLRQIDRILASNGAREGIATVSRVPLERIAETFETRVGRD